eukprot:351897-Chlamydomonas_euryale.AAC.2
MAHLINTDSSVGRRKTAPKHRRLTSCVPDSSWVTRERRDGRGGRSGRLRERPVVVTEMQRTGGLLRLCNAPVATRRAGKRAPVAAEPPSAAPSLRPPRRAQRENLPGPETQGASRGGAGR